MTFILVMLFQYGNMSMYFEKQFDSANQAMVNSEIPIRYGDLLKV